jgi:hypothetical protein
MIGREAATHPTPLFFPTRRSFLGALAAAGAFGRFLFGAPSLAEADPCDGSGAAFDSLHSVKAAADGDESIRPFRINFPEAAIVDLRRRIAATNWPERETVTDATQGVQLATMRELARYWQKDYDWRKGFMNEQSQRPLTPSSPSDIKPVQWGQGQEKNWRSV